jgi:CheY-like chemotaxis protein
MAQTLIADAGDLWDYLSEAKKSALLASGLSQRLITFAEGGAPVRSLVCLPAVIQDAVRPAVIGSHARGELSLPGNLWSVEADERQIKQALQNVIQNAIEAMTEARVVAVQAENLTLSSPAEGALPPGDYVRISITDRGRGIPPEDLPKVFDPYFSTKQRGVRKGMGLGLTIAHTIINKHGGAMSVESKVGKGTTVRLFLPASRKPPVTGEAALPPDNPQRARILVMDDEAGLRTVLSATLRRLGHTVELAEDGRQAIEAYAQAKHAGRPFDLVMLDLTVHGGVGGYEAMLGLREIDPGVKAILMSGYSTDRIFLNYESAGFKAALAKPFDLAKVKESIAWALGT